MRLIDADALTEKLKHLWNTHDYVDFNKKDVWDVWDELENTPTVDAVEVVRCEDCKWCDTRTNDCHNPRFGDGWANYPPPSVREDFFCGDGERRDSDG